MFGKLLKYELKSVGKWYLSLYAMSILASVILGFWIKYLSESVSSSSESIFQAIISIITFLAFGAIIAALGLSTLFLIIRRFKNNIYGRQGYLTMTLPASTHQIILSKLTSAVIWNALAMVTILISFFIIAFILGGIQFFFSLDLEAFKEVFDLFLQPAYFINVAVNALTSVLMIYLAISIGHLAEDYRILLSFVAYFIIQALIVVISMLTADQLLYNINDINFYYLISSLFYAILGLIAYFTTHYLITNKLNIH